MSKTLVLLTAASLLAISAVTLPAFANDEKEQASIAASPDSGTMDRADGDMKRVLQALQDLGGKPIETLTPTEARQQPTPADAVMKVLRDKGKDPQKLIDKMEVTTQNVSYPTAMGMQPARVYAPEDRDDGPLPVIVYYHGGGFVIADLSTYDATPRAMAKLVNAVVVSVEYRHAPENKFPAAHDDAVAAYKWVLTNAATWGGDPTRIAVMGESAGGSLAANVAIAARDQELRLPLHMALIYPVAGNDTNTRSYQDNINAKPLNKAMMEWFFNQTVSSEEDKKDPRLNLLAANLMHLPEATIITADIDPLRSDGKNLYDALISAGVNSEYKNYEGVTHEFFGMAFVVSDAKAAQKFVAGQLKDAFRVKK